MSMLEPILFLFVMLLLLFAPAEVAGSGRQTARARRGGGRAGRPGRDSVGRALPGRATGHVAQPPPPIPLANLPGQRRTGGRCHSRGRDNQRGGRGRGGGNRGGRAHHGGRLPGGDVVQQPPQAPALIRYSALEVLRQGLDHVGFEGRQNVRESSNIERFRAFYGIGPAAVAELIRALQQTQIDEAKCEFPNLKDLFMTLYWLKSYDTEIILSGWWKRCDDTVRKWKWFYGKKIAALKDKKASWNCVEHVHSIGLRLLTLLAPDCVWKLGAGCRLLDLCRWSALQDLGLPSEAHQRYILAQVELPGGSSFTNRARENGTQD